MLIAIVAGLAFHAAYRHTEPTVLFVLSTYIASFVSLPCVFMVYFRLTLLSALVHTLCLQATYTASMLASIAAYRLFFHRCSSFPGQTKDGLSKWFSFREVKDLTLYRKQTRLVEKYGDIVRSGPRELLIADPIAIRDLFGAKEYLHKGRSLMGQIKNQGARAMTSENERRKHKRRRQLWDRALSINAVRKYENAMKMKTLQLMEQLEKKSKAGHDVRLGDWLKFLVFDLMGLLGFMRDFHMVEAGQTTEQLAILECYTGVIGLFLHLPYLGQFLRQLPLPSPQKPLERWVDEAVRERVEKYKDRPSGEYIDEAGFSDVFGYLLASEDDQSLHTHTRKELEADAVVLVFAGGDTLVRSLTMVLFELIKHPTWIKEIRDELTAVFGQREWSECIDLDMLTKECRVLNAVINEGFRLWPALFSSTFRETPKDDDVPVRLRDHRTIVIPRATNILVPIYSLHRDPRNFSRPNEFRPQRWLETAKEEKFCQEAFLPFMYGPRNCVGKQLAYAEMRVIVSQLILRFHVAFAPGFDEEKFRSGIGAQVAMTIKEDLLVCLTPRNETRKDKDKDE